MIEGVNKPGYVFDLTADLGCNRGFTIRGNFAKDETLENMNKEMDKLVRACDRQLCRAVIPAMESKLREEERTLKTFLDNLEGTRKKAQGYKSLPVQAEAEIRNAETTIAAQKAKIAEQKVLIERTKKDAE